MKNASRVQQEVNQAINQENQQELYIAPSEILTLSIWTNDIDLFTPGWENVQTMGVLLFQKLAIYRLLLRFERTFPKLTIILKVGVMIGIPAALAFVIGKLFLVVGAIFAAWAIYFDLLCAAAALD